MNGFPVKGTINVYYHFYFPDDVVSADHFKGLCEGLVERGWQVTVFTSNRYCRKAGKITNRAEIINGVTVKRSWRPAFDQSGHAGRLINGFFTSVGWIFRTITSEKPDFFIVGTDPQFSQLLFPFLKISSRKSKLVHWCFDLYPEAVMASTDNAALIKACRISQPFFKFLYKFVDVLVDIGPCMRKRLDLYQPRAQQHTLVPWALAEAKHQPKTDSDKRKKLFGERELILLYSGNLGQAHQYELFLQLARRLRDQRPSILFAFSSSGNRINEFKSQVSEKDSNVIFLPFAPLEELQDRLTAADIHLLSLRNNWCGIVVPSKFFGSLAMGRPLLYDGPEDSSINQWIEESNLGLRLTKNNIEKIANELLKISSSSGQLKRWQNNSYDTYYANFSKNTILDKWDLLLSASL